MRPCDPIDLSESGVFGSASAANSTLVADQALFDHTGMRLALEGERRGGLEEAVDLR